jgi:hypothetical protein
VSAVQKLSGAMQMSAAFAPPLDLDALQHPRLKRSTKFLYGPEAIRVGSLLEFVERVQAWFRVELDTLSGRSISSTPAGTSLRIDRRLE